MLYMRISHKHSVSTAPDEHMAYIIQLHIMNIQPANKAAEYLIRGRERERGRERGRGREREGEREGGREREGEREREREGERGREREREREREKRKKELSALFCKASLKN